MITILKRLDRGGHDSSPRYTRHATTMGSSITACGLLLGQDEKAKDAPSVQGRIKNCGRCLRLTDGPWPEARP